MRGARVRSSARVIIRPPENMNAESRKTSVRPAWSLARYRHCAALPLRLIIGYGFVAHGCAKLLRGPEVFAVTLDHLGVPMPHLMGWLAILVELIGGLAVLLGAFTLFASVPLAIIMLVAMFTVHLAHGFSSIKLQAVTAAWAQFGPPGYEINLLYLAALATLVLSGAGPWSVDEWLDRRETRSGTQRRGHV